jgi:Fe-S cluster assembly ATPase SufC
MLDGRIVYSGEPRELFGHIQRHGYTVPSAPAGASV